MDDIWNRFIENLFGRLDGPLHFRFFMQPAMAIIFAVIDGIKDAKLGRPAYFWAVVKDPDQIKVYHWFYPGETLVVAIFLAIIPYLLVRGPVNRIATWRANKVAQDLQAKNRA